MCSSQLLSTAMMPQNIIVHHISNLCKLGKEEELPDSLDMLIWGYIFKLAEYGSTAQDSLVFMSP
jgi:hypothetical protein